MQGFYVEAAHPILPYPSPREVVGFVRYEQFDTQYKMPAGYLPIGAFNRSAWVAGVSYFPDPDVVVKVDYTVGRNRQRRRRRAKGRSAWGSDGGSESEEVLQ